jgi:hypothetical protein
MKTLKRAASARGQLAIGLVLTFGTRMFAMYLAQKVDRATALPRSARASSVWQRIGGI